MSYQDDWLKVLKSKHGGIMSIGLLSKDLECVKRNNFLL